MDYKVLIVDDQKENTILLQEIIGSYFNKIEIEVAMNGYDAEELCHKHSFDIIFLDVMMPERDGFETAESIRQTKNSDTTIVFVTAQESRKELITKGFRSGGIDYLHKPINPGELYKLLNLYFRFINRERNINQKLHKLNEELNEEIEARKILEACLVKAKEDFRNIVGKSNAAILITDNNGRIQFVNPAAEIVFMRKSNELTGEIFGDTSDFDKKTEITIVRKNGDVGTGEITTTQTIWDNKPAWLVLINDITEHKKLQESLLQAKQKAQESDRLKTAFLSNMSHEIRTPMNGIIGFAEMLKRNDLTKEDKFHYLNIITRCGGHLLNLINDIIDLSKIETGQLDIKKDKTNIKQLVTEVCDFFSSHEKVSKKVIDLKPDPNVYKNGIILETDRERLRQILTNLINNSLKFTEQGHIKVGFEPRLNEIQFYVEDTGIGINKEKQELVFDRFMQAHTNRDYYTEGTGLGLAICRSLVNLLGGKIWLESQPGKGSVFYFTVPYIGFKKIVPPTVKKQRPCNEEKLKKMDLSNRSILIVEDIDINFILLNELLKKYSTKLFRGKNGKEAIEIFKKESIDLILMDIKLPEVDGITATREIRKLNKEVPIIAQTAYALEGEKDKFIKAGCNEYISKPIIEEELIEKICLFL